MLMYDSINVDAIPADAECVLVYTDGKFANETAMRQRFPNAIIQTISATGTVPAMWIDVESGCVWPPEAAVAVYQAWRGQGCKGFYSTVANQPAIQQALQHVQINPKLVEWFDADWNDVPHIDAGDSETQFESLPGYDVSEVADPPVPDPAPAPVPVPQLSEESMFVAVSTGSASASPQPVIQPNTHFLVFANGTKYVVETPSDVSALVGKLGLAVELTCSFLAWIPNMPLG